LKERIILLVFLSGVLFTLFTPIEDPDFFWHIATGKWIYEHKELPREDPFSYTTSPQTQKEVSTARSILTRYWLGNLIQYGTYEAGGYAGIIALRLFIALLTLLIVLRQLRETGLSIAASVLSLLPLAYLFTIFKGDRPNEMTFLFLAIFLFLIDSLKKGKKVGYLLPVALLAWANLHAGFILGSVISLIYLFSELTRMFLAHKGLIRDYQTNKKLLWGVALTILLGFVNPNGYLPLYSESIAQTFSPYKTTENYSPLSYTQIGDYTLLFSTIFLFITSLLSILLSILYRTKDTPGPPRKFEVDPQSRQTHNRESGFVSGVSNALEEILLVLFLGGISFTAVRYLPLFAIAVIPVIGRLLRGRLDFRIRRFSRSGIGMLVVIVLFCLSVYKAYPDTVLKNRFVGSDYPAEAVRFMKQHKLDEGRVFNYIDWGGYLIWNFYPEKIVFTDGRNLNENIKKLYLLVSNGNTEPVMGIPAYQAVFDTYAIQHVLIPPIDLTGYFLPLVYRLVNDPQWRLVFVSEDALLFSRDYSDAAYPKRTAYEIAIRKSLSNIRSNPDNPAPYITVAKCLMDLGRKSEAVNYLRNSIQQKKFLRGGPVGRTLRLLEEGRDISLP
jgi:hypothetical protein